MVWGPLVRGARRMPPLRPRRRVQRLAGSPSGKVRRGRCGRHARGPARGSESAGRSAGRSVGGSSGRPVGRSVDRSAGRPVGRPAGRPVDRSAGRPTTSADSLQRPSREDCCAECHYRRRSNRTVVCTDGTSLLQAAISLYKPDPSLGHRICPRRTSCFRLPPCANTVPCD